jgi:hypothetical protein
MRYLTGLIFLFLAAQVALAQDRPDSPDSWNGLMLDESTVEDAIAVLGDPRKDREDQKFNTRISSWLAKDGRFRRLEYRKVADVDKAYLYFQNDHLKVIELDLDETFAAVKLPLYYEMRYFLQDDSGVLHRDPFEEGIRTAGGEFPTTFNIVGIGATSFLVALVVHQGASRLLYDQTRLRMDVPGDVQVIQLVSRLLQASDVPDRLTR